MALNCTLYSSSHTTILDKTCWHMLKKGTFPRIQLHPSPWMLQQMVSIFNWQFGRRWAQRTTPNQHYSGKRGFVSTVLSRIVGPTINMLYVRSAPCVWFSATVHMYISAAMYRIFDSTATCSVMLYLYVCDETLCPASCVCCQKNVHPRRDVWMAHQSTQHNTTQHLSWLNHEKMKTKRNQKQNKNNNNFDPILC